MFSFKNCSIALFILFPLLFCMQCAQVKQEVAKQEMGVVLEFEHWVEGKPLVVDTLMYINAAGNRYEVNEIQWFISDVQLVKESGEELRLDSKGFSHYVDTDIPESLSWEIADELPEGNYTAIAFTFGLRGEKNKPYQFTDPPESDMLWPMHLGGKEGGYHYMKLNGFWENASQERDAFNLHLGVGQRRNGQGEVIGFVQNWFEVTLPLEGFQFEKEKNNSITLVMNVDKWFENPTIYDLDQIGGKIMQNQEAMGLACENGKDVFSILPPMAF
ncbi:MbnP family protein [Flammeovirgaceae bacterium SG7u.111]|nr:MbnP family protein [Flammeovirgaceae bacterium SG7u.132]WPO33757.1 MbnP family protein [Flammeovirgaceae bacterium SG7u.111]